MIRLFNQQRRFAAGNTHMLHVQASGAFHDVYATDEMVHRSGYDGQSPEAWEVGLPPATMDPTTLPMPSCSRKRNARCDCLQLCSEVCAGKSTHSAGVEDLDMTP